MRSIDAEVAFPLLGISADKDVWGFADLRELTTCGPRTIRDRMQDGMELIDANGQRWRVVSVRSLGRAGSVWTRWLMTLLTAVPQYRIEQTLEDLGRVELAYAQAKACEALEAHPDFWCDDDERDTVLPRRLAEVRSTTSIAGIHEVLELDTFESY